MHIKHLHNVGVSKAGYEARLFAEQTAQRRVPSSLPSV